MSFPAYDPEGFGGEPELAPEAFGTDGFGPPPTMPGAPRLPPGFSNAELEKQLDLRVPLDADEQRKEGFRWAQEWAYFQDTFARRRQNAQDWRDDAAVMPDNPVLDWRGAQQADRTAWMAKSRSFLTATAIDSTVQNLSQQIVSPQPPFLAVPDQPMYEINGVMVDLVQRAADVQEAWQALLERAGWAQSCRELFREMATASPCARKTTWARKSVWVAERTLTQDEDLLMALLETGEPPDEALLASIETDRSGRPRVKAKFKEQVTYEGAEFTVIPMEDLVWFPATARHVDNAFAIGERVRVRGCDLIEKLKDKQSGYYREAVEKLLATPSDAPTETERQQQERVAMAVPGAPTAEDDPEYREWQCIELAYKGKLGGEKMDKWYWLTFHPGTQTLLRCCYILDRHGKCPYTIYNLRGEKLVGMSIAEINAVYQSTYTTLLNNALDLVSIMVGCAGSFLYDSRTKAFDPNTFTLNPGTQTPIKGNPKDIIFHLPLPDNIPMALREILNMLGVIRENSQTLTSTSNISLGKEAAGDKTATEIEAVFGQDQAIAEQQGYGIAILCAQDLEKFRQLEAQYASQATKSYVANGETGMKHVEIEAELLAAPYTIVPAGLSAASSGQARLQKAMMALQVVMGNPILATPETILDCLESVLQALGVGNTKIFIARAKQMLLMQQQAQAEAAGLQDQAAQEKGALIAGEVERAGAANAKAKPGANGKMAPPQGPSLMEAIAASEAGGGR